MNLKKHLKKVAIPEAEAEAEAVKMNAMPLVKIARKFVSKVLAFVRIKTG